MVISESCIGGDLGGSGRRKPSVRIAGLKAEISVRDQPNTKQEC
jgi:hypothetical protein